MFIFDCMKIRFGIFLLLIVQMQSLHSQSQLVENGPLYTHEEIPKIFIAIDEDSLSTLYLEENWYENHEYSAQFIFESSTNVDTLEDVGLRFRGNTSRDKFKKSFKVSFNTFEPGRKLYGVEKMNLNAEVNDPSMVRSFSTWELYHQMGLVAPRSNHIELYINGEYYGLYQNAEHIDEEFADTWFGSKVGNLYKCSYPANLDYISNNPDDYKVAPWGTRTYELKTNEEQDDYSDISEFIIFLNQAPEIDFQCRFSEYFDVFSYIKIAAVDVLTGNWDGYIYNQNNFYLYHNVLTNQIEYIPYDVDNTWGIDWLDRNWSNRNIYTWSQTSAPRPLYNRIMDNDVFRDIFSWHIQNMLSNSYGTEDHIAAIESVHDFISASALADPYRPIDFDYSDSDFLSALDIEAGGHVDYAVLPFLDIRKNTASSQVENVTIAPIVSGVTERFQLLPGAIEIKVAVEGPDALTASLDYSIDGNIQTALSISGNQDLYEFEIALSQLPVTIAYNVSVLGDGGLSRQAFCESRIIKIGSENPGLLINEVMTSNSSTIQDQDGEFEDWIEVYNTSENSEELDEVYLSDNHSAPLKWAMRQGSISSNDHKLFWADKDLEQGPDHTNFNLNASGETVYLTKKIENGIHILDFVSVPAIPSDYSYGRNFDGGIAWQLFESPTPNAMNDGFVGLFENEKKSINPYPNPTKGEVYFGYRYPYIVTDISGRIIETGIGDAIDLGFFVQGIYLVEFGNQKFKIVKYD